MKTKHDRPISLGAFTFWFGRIGARYLVGMGRPELISLGFALVTGLVGASSRAQSTDNQQTGEEPRAKVAARPSDSSSNHSGSLELSPLAAERESIHRAKQMIANCKAQYDTVRDYTCTFYKRERISGSLSDTQVMHLKVRTQPLSFYIKCVNPRKGREAIWVKGKNDGKVVAHDAGFVKVLAGTMYLDPKGGVAMEDNRHPITDAGLGNLIETVRQSWDLELKPGETKVAFHPHMKVGARPCTMIETTHPKYDSSFVFHRVRLYIDDQLGLPIRIEGYNWPTKPGADPELLEEYTYAHLRINPGLAERDFDPANPAYSYGRF